MLRRHIATRSRRVPRSWEISSSCGWTWACGGIWGRVLASGAERARPTAAMIDACRSTSTAARAVELTSKCSLRSALESGNCAARTVASAGSRSSSRLLLPRPAQRRVLTSASRVALPVAPARADFHERADLTISSIVPGHSEKNRRGRRRDHSRAETSHLARRFLAQSTESVDQRHT